jgi:acetyl-CoA carboxylase biotin carboxyl carrier protein
MSIKNEEIKSLLTFFEKSDWQELRLEVEGVKIAVSKNGSLTTSSAAAPAAAATSAVAAPVALPAAAVAPAAKPSAPSPSTELAAGQVYLRAPSLGVVWGQSKPGAPPFVQEGQLIEAGTPLCLIEVMKLFTQVTSNVKGKIVRRLVADGEMVEHDAPLFIIEVA